MRPADNPFRSEAIHKLPFWGANVHDIYHSWRRADYRGEIVGHHGCGKTTLFLELLTLARAQGEIATVCTFRRESGLIQQDCSLRLSEPELCHFIDGADLMSAASRALIRNLRVLCTSHYSLGLPEIYRCTTTPELLRSLIESLTSVDVGAASAAKLFQRHGGNLRDVFWELYDRWAVGDPMVPYNS